MVRLVSSALEIRLDVDEGNLADLAVGQEAVISSSVFPGDAFHGRVSEIGAAVDQTRGTVTVRVLPLQPPDWLRGTNGERQYRHLPCRASHAHPRLSGRPLWRPDRRLRRRGRPRIGKVVLTRPPRPRGYQCWRA